MASSKIPQTMKQIMVTTLSTDFRKATEVQDVKLERPTEDQILVKTMFVGINATDINFTAGSYSQDTKNPFPAGLEGLGEVVEAGANAKTKKGDFVVYMKIGAFAEYVIIPDAMAIVVPDANPAYLSIVISGLTASISLAEQADLKPGKNVLVTAAAGGTGQYAVQLAKLAGCNVIGTCSSDEKVEFLKSLKCDRVINYKKEDFSKVLSEEYKDAIDVVYECVGQEFFSSSLNNLRTKGRMIIIGMISTYKEGIAGTPDSAVNVPLICLRKSASVKGFFLVHHRDVFPEHVMKLITLYKSGDLQLAVHRFEKSGLEHVVDAVEFMFSGKNKGKLVVAL